MELGQHLQIFVSLIVILGAAFVALICDYLKGNNEQLRELMVELKTRREEQKRWLLMARRRIGESRGSRVAGQAGAPAALCRAPMKFRITTRLPLVKIL